MNRRRLRTLLGLGAAALVLAGCGRTATVAAESGGDAGAAAGVVKDGKPQGLFFMTRYWSYTHTLEKAAWYFTADGEAYENLESGVAAEDLKAHKGRHGTVRVTGDTMEITWPDGKSSKSKIEQDKKTFMWDMGIFSPAEPIASTKSIAGTYEGGESLSHGGNKVATGKKLQLHADGTFQLEGVALVQGDTADSILYAGAESGSSGMWDASGYQLTFKESGGKTLRQLAFPFPVNDEKAAHPDHVFIGGMLYKRLGE